MKPSEVSYAYAMAAGAPIKPRTDGTPISAKKLVIRELSAAQVYHLIG